MVRCAPVRRSLRALALVACVLLGTAAGAATAPASDAPVITVSDSLRGRSGRLRFRVIRPDAAPVEELDVLARAFGEEIFSLPGIFGAVDSASADTFHFASLVPFAEKQDGRVGVYRVGRWPAEVLPWQVLANLRHDQGDLAGAEQALRAAFRLKPSATTLNHLAVVLLERGCPVRARTALDRAQARDPSEAEREALRGTRAQVDAFRGPASKACRELAT